MINGFIISYDIRSVDVLVNDNLKWKNLETSRSLVNATLMYKIVLMINLSPSNSPLQNDSSTNHDNLRNLETDLALPRPKRISSKVVLSIMVQCAGTIFLTKQNSTIAFRI